MMIKKGDCKLVTKVHNAEMSGAHLAIIINDSDDNVEKQFLNGDGVGADISIAAVLISKSDGEKLIEYYKEHMNNHDEIKEIKLEIKFENENMDYTVKYDVWYSPEQGSAYSFFKEFKHFQSALGNRAILGIHFFTYPDFDYKDNSKQNIKNCLGSGLYCIRPGKSQNYDGRNIIRESLRQRCIFNYTYENTVINKKELLWEYFEKYYEKCVVNRNFESSCSEEILAKLGIPVDYIQKCYEESFIGDKNEQYFDIYLKNELLDKDYELRKINFITKSPSITINDRLYMGTWRPEYIFESLCASLLLKPEACYVEVNFNRKINGVSLAEFLIWILVTILVNIGLFLVCKYIIRKGVDSKIDSSDISYKVDNAVESYLALRGTQEQEN